MTSAAVDLRKSRGALLAASNSIRRVRPNVFVVPSQNSPGSAYIVDYDAKSCTCPDHAESGLTCKHWWAVELSTHPEPANDSASTPMKKPTYSQNWSAYNAAQTTEKTAVELLLHELCCQLPAHPRKRGRPRLALADLVYAAVMKVFLTLSGRRSSCDIRAGAERGLISAAPHYNSVFRFMESPEATPILRNLVEESAAPLAPVERDFAVDSTGFTGCTYTRWLTERGLNRREHDWVKCHAMVGVRTHVVTAAEVTEGATNDCPLLPTLVERTKKRFQIQEVAADKAYPSFANFQAVEDAGGSPFIMFKSNTVGDRGPSVWRKLFTLFALNRDEYLKHYHKRSNVEALFSSLKRKFSASIRGRSPTAMYNEVYARIIAHNLSMLVHATHELGIEVSLLRGSAPAEGGAR